MEPAEPVKEDVEDRTRLPTWAAGAISQNNRKIMEQRFTDSKDGKMLEQPCPDLSPEEIQQEEEKNRKREKE